MDREIDWSQFNVKDATIKRQENTPFEMNWDWLLEELQSGRIRITYYGDTQNGQITPKKIRERLHEELKELGLNHG